MSYIHSNYKFFDLVLFSTKALFLHMYFKGNITSFLMFSTSENYVAVCRVFSHSRSIGTQGTMR
jgi:hypothetical protein